MLVRVCVWRENTKVAAGKKKASVSDASTPRPRGAAAWTLWEGSMSTRRESRSASGQQGDKKVYQGYQVTQSEGVGGERGGGGGN